MLLEAWGLRGLEVARSAGGCRRVEEEKEREDEEKRAVVWLAGKVLGPERWGTSVPWGLVGMLGSWEAGRDCLDVQGMLGCWEGGRDCWDTQGMLGCWDRMGCWGPSDALGKAPGKELGKALGEDSACIVDACM